MLDQGGKGPVALGTLAYPRAQSGILRGIFVASAVAEFAYEDSPLPMAAGSDYPQPHIGSTKRVPPA